MILCETSPLTLLPLLCRLRFWCHLLSISNNLRCGLSSLNLWLLEVCLMLLHKSHIHTLPTLTIYLLRAGNATGVQSTEQCLNRLGSRGNSTSFHFSFSFPPFPPSKSSIKVLISWLLFQVGNVQPSPIAVSSVPYPYSRYSAKSFPH